MSTNLNIIFLGLFFSFVLKAQNNELPVYLCPLKHEVYFYGPSRLITDVEESFARSILYRELDSRVKVGVSKTNSGTSVLREDYFSNLDSSEWIKIVNVIFPAETNFNEKTKRLERTGHSLSKLMRTKNSLYQGRAQEVIRLLKGKNANIFSEKKGYLYIPLGFSEFHPAGTFMIENGNPGIVGFVGLIIFNLETGFVEINIKNFSTQFLDLRDWEEYTFWRLFSRKNLK